MHKLMTTECVCTEWICLSAPSTSTADISCPTSWKKLIKECDLLLRTEIVSSLSISWPHGNHLQEEERKLRSHSSHETHKAGLAKWTQTRDLKNVLFPGNPCPPPPKKKVLDRDWQGELARRRSKFSQLVTTRKCNDTVFISFDQKKERKKKLADHENLSASSTCRWC